MAKSLQKGIRRVPVVYRMNSTRSLATDTYRRLGELSRSFTSIHTYIQRGALPCLDRPARISACRGRRRSETLRNATEVQLFRGSSIEGESASPAPCGGSFAITKPCRAALVPGLAILRRKQVTSARAPSSARQLNPTSRPLPPTGCRELVQEARSAAKESMHLVCGWRWSCSRCGKLALH